MPDMLHATWWELFHHLWGNNKDNIYDKPSWLELQVYFEKLEHAIAQGSDENLKRIYIKNYDRRETERRRG